MIFLSRIKTDVPALFRWLALSLACYVLLEKTGVFRAAPAGWLEIMRSWPARTFSVLFLVLAIIQLAQQRGQQGPERYARMLASAAIVVMALGFWISFLTRFEGKTLKAEGESFSAFPGEYVKESVLYSRYSQHPEFGVTILKLRPETADGGAAMRRVRADVKYFDRTSNRVLDAVLGSGWPLITDRTALRITDFGYMPKYVLYDLRERELESQKVYMKLFPPGAEEYFRTLFLGYVFYLQCYPDYVDKDGAPATLSPYPRNPVFHLRIARNKDIVYSGLLKPSEKVRFDNVVVAVPEVKMWVEISFVRDLGLPVFIFGGGLLALAGILRLLFTRTVLRPASGPEQA